MMVNYEYYGNTPSAHMKWQKLWTGTIESLRVTLLIPCRSEKDASTWSKEKLRSLLVGLTFDGPEGTCLCTYFHVCVYIS